MENRKISGKKEKNDKTKIRFEKYFFDTKMFSNDVVGYSD